MQFQRAWKRNAETGRKEEKHGRTEWLNLGRERRKGKGRSQGQVIKKGGEEKGGNEKCSSSVKDEEKGRHVLDGKNGEKRKREKEGEEEEKKEERGRSSERRRIIWEMEKDMEGEWMATERWRLKIKEEQRGNDGIQLWRSGEDDGQESG